jgi:hypothetical protein
MDVSEALHVVEHQPRQGYDHQNNERDGDEQNRCSETNKQTVINYRFVKERQNSR